MLLGKKSANLLERLQGRPNSGLERLNELAVAVQAFDLQQKGL